MGELRELRSVRPGPLPDWGHAPCPGPTLPFDREGLHRKSPPRTQLFPHSVSSPVLNTLCLNP